MYRLFKTTLAVSLVGIWLVSALSAQDRAAVEHLRVELAKILKKDAAQLPIDKPVAGLGADALDVIEWQMAAEKAFHVSISDDELFDPKAKTTTVRKELTISSMAGIVAKSKKTK